MQGHPRIAQFLVPMAAGLCAALLCLSNVADRGGLAIYDALLGLRPETGLASEVLLLEYDEATGARAWDGEELAEGLATMAELGASYAVFPDSSSFATAMEGARSPRASLSSAIDKELSQIDANVGALFDAIRLGSVSPKDSPRYVAELLQTIDAGKARLLVAASGSADEERKRIEGALRLFGRAYIAIEPLADGQGGGLLLDPKAARGTGFAPSILDADGSRRRIALLSSRRLGGYEQPSFLALIDRLGGPALAAGPDSIVIKGGSLRGSSQTPTTAGGRAAAKTIAYDIAIPLSRGGLLIDWPRSGSGSPRRLAWGDLAYTAALEDEFVAALNEMGKAGYLVPGGGSLPGLHEYATGLADAALAGSASLAEWEEARDRYFELSSRFLGGKAESQLVAAAEARAASNPGEAAALRSRIDSIRGAFTGARETRAQLDRARAHLKAALAGSFCVVAPSRAAAGLRLNPRGGQASEGLATATAIGSILSERFLRELPPILGVALGLALAIATAVASLWLGTKWALIEGFSLALVGAGGCAVLFLATGRYLSPLAPAIAPLVTALVALAMARRGNSPQVPGIL